MQVIRYIVLGLFVLVLLMSIAPLLVPLPSQEGRLSSRELADADSRFVEVNGIEIHYKISGSGEPALVFVHGFADSTFSWRKVTEPLTQDYTVLAYDRPAFGLTERPLPGEWNGENPYSLAAQPDLLIGLLNTLGIERVILVGHSAGGAVAVQTALTYPQRVEALVLVAPAIIRTQRWWGVFQFLLHTPQMDRLGPWLARLIQWQEKQMVEIAWHDPSTVTSEDMEGYRKPLRVRNWERALWEFSRAEQDTGLAERVDELKMPVIIVAGDDDRVVPTEQSIYLAEQIPGAQLAVLPACGHVPQDECPEAFLQAVQSFLNGLK